MNRKQFLKNCAGGLCSCTAIGLLIPTPSAAAESKPPEDWRWPFVKKRYARLIEILAGKINEAALNEILRESGYSCAQETSSVRKHKGDLDGYIRELKERGGEDVTYDREQGIITVTGPERDDCFCPLITKKLTPQVACNCSLGWQECALETVLGKKVKVALKDSVLRGGKRCIFEIQVLA